MYTILFVGQRAKYILEVRDLEWGEALPGEALRELMAQLFCSTISSVFLQAESPYLWRHFEHYALETDLDPLPGQHYIIAALRLLTQRLSSTCQVSLSYLSVAGMCPSHEIFIHSDQRKR